MKHVGDICINTFCCIRLLLTRRNFYIFELSLDFVNEYGWIGGIHIDRRSDRPRVDGGSDRPIIKKGPIDRGSDRTIIEKGPIARGADRPIIEKGPIDRLLEGVL